jgi:UDP-N-acetylmuramoylalanine--D-glutamate ligase
VTATGLWLAEREGRRVIGVTGTKGKSTTATMAAHLVRASGLRAHLAGNIGRPVLDLLDAPADEWAVVELSSYQIADLAEGPEVAVVTNLYREHIDWHGDEGTYRREKLRLLGLPGVDACVISASPELVAAAGSARVVHFGQESGWHVAEDGIRDGGALAVPVEWLPLRGRHNAENLCAALAALDAAWIQRPPLPEAVDGIAALPHRLQTVHSAGGVEWVDDSISTTPESTIAALDAYPGRPVVLIAGGLDRDQDYAALGAMAARRDATVLALPVTGARLAEAARAAGATHVTEVADMAEAVAAARKAAGPDTVVLLSPAAPSYNSYRNFEERGDHFAALASSAR